VGCKGMRCKGMRCKGMRCKGMRKLSAAAVSDTMSRPARLGHGASGSAQHIVTLSYIMIY
jgi:hypothetical protein